MATSDTISVTIKADVKPLQTAVNGAIKSIGQFGASIKNLVPAGAQNAASSVFGKIQNAANAAFTKVKNVAANMGTAVSKTLSSFVSHVPGIQKIGTAFSTVASKVSPVLNRIGAVGKASFGILTSAANVSKAAIQALGSTFKRIGETEIPFLGVSVKDVFSRVGSAIKTGMAAASVAVAGIAKSAVSSFAEYEQLVGGVETLFKDSSNTVMQYADNAYKTAGLSANEYMNTVTSFSASLLQGLKGDTAAAAKVADLAVTDMADNANKMGTGIEMIQNAYQGFAKQNYTMLDNLKLGYGGTAGEMARLINDSGVLGKTTKVTADTVNSVSFNKMVEAIHAVQDKMGITGTTAKEASSTIQGSVSSMKAAWQNMLTGMSDDTQNFEQLVSNLIGSVGDVFKNMIPTVQVALTGASQLITDLVPIITEALPGLVTAVLPGIIQATVSLFTALIGAIPNILQSIVESGLISQLVNALTTVFNTLITMIPQLLPPLLQLFVQLIQGLVQNLPSILSTLITAFMQICDMLTQPENLTMILQAAIQLLMAVLEAIPELISGLVSALPAIIDNIVMFLLDPENLNMIIQGAIQLFFGLVKAVPQILGALLSAFGNLVGRLWDHIKNLFANFAGNFGEFIGGIFKGAINGLLSFIEGMINSPISIINGFIDVINSVFGVVGVNLGHLDGVHLPRMKHGGILGGTSYDGDRQLFAGNTGEMVINRSQQASLWNAISSGNFGEGGTHIESGGVIVNVYVNATSDPKATAVATVKAIKQAFISQGIVPEIKNAGALR